jgi:Dipeptidyl peptidase IV (DPP IV) N-terminal region
VHYVESSPEDQLQPKHSTLQYAKPGDVLDVERPFIFHVASRKQIAVDNALFPNAYDMTRLEWRPDGSAVTLEYNQRGHQLYRVIAIDPASGAARAVVTEESKTFFCYSGKKYRHDLADGKEIKHNKDFELLVIPGAGHGNGGAYGEHKRFDFFTRHLLGQTPPEWKTLEELLKKGTSPATSLQ